MTALAFAAVVSALVWPVIIVLLLVRAERRILARIDRLLAAVGMKEPSSSPPPRTAPPLGDLAGLRAERGRRADDRADER